MARRKSPVSNRSVNKKRIGTSAAASHAGGGNTCVKLSEPPKTCDLCPRLVEYRTEIQAAHPDWFNGAVPSFGDRPTNVRLLIVGLAPGLQGANRTGRPFTGDYAGDLLYSTLIDFGFATGCYERCADDTLRLTETMITNAVRCVPPANKPTGEEIKTCRPFLHARIRSLPRLAAILALGRVAHEQTLAALELRRSQFPFAHGASHDIGAASWEQGLRLYDSFHCSRYNTNTRRLTEDMFRSVFKDIRAQLDGSHS